MSRRTLARALGSLTLGAIFPLACASNIEVSSEGAGSGPGGQSGASEPTAGDRDVVFGAGDEDSSSESDGTQDFGAVCAEGEAAAEAVPANLLFVVDKSGSMNCNAPPTDASCLSPEKTVKSEASKWEITQQALTAEGGALETLAGQVGVNVGLLAFPSDDFCAVPSEGELTVSVEALTSEHLEVLETGLKQTAEGQTPLAGAAIRGLESLRRQIDAGSLQGNHYLVLMTDGAETCQSSALKDLLFYVEQARYYYGISTFAIGAPGSEASRNLLSEVAVLGGTRRSADCSKRPESASESCHIDLTESEEFAKDLGREFQGIAEAAAKSCIFDVPATALVDPGKVNVEYVAPDGSKELVARDVRREGAAQCFEADGWQFSPDGTQIHLCGGLCEAIQGDAGGEVRVVFGCKETVVR